MFKPNKKPALDVMVAVGKPKPPAALKGAPGIPDMKDEEETTEEPMGDDSNMKECLYRVESMVRKIAEAVGVDVEEDSMPAKDESDTSEEYGA